MDVQQGVRCQVPQCKRMFMPQLHHFFTLEAPSTGLEQADPEPRQNRPSSGHEGSLARAAGMGFVALASRSGGRTPWG